MTSDLSDLIKNLTYEEYQILAGAGWPAFDDIKSGTDIPDFVVEELSRMIKPQIKTKRPYYVEFYITNVCNLTCSECRSFNNFDFKGHYEFDVELYRPWSEKLPLDSYVLLGGEPLLHPQFKEWVEGTRRLWPDAWAKIDSNGTQITKVKNLHQLLVDNEYFICINIHDSRKQEQMLQDVVTAFGECDKIDSTDPRIHYNERFAGKQGHYVESGYWLISKLGLPIHIRPAWTFQKMITSSTKWQDLVNETINPDSIYIGDPKPSHDLCDSATCHVMYEGKIYKCSTVATMPKFLEQANIKWPNNLIHQYQPLTIDNFSADGYHRLEEQIPQCSFCPIGGHAFVDISSASGVKKKKNKIIPIIESGAG
jgi:hypothetical protein